MKNVDAGNFQSEVLESQLPVLVDFYSDYCPPCRALAPQLEQIEAEFAGCVKIVKVNAGEAGSLALRYRVQAVPTLMLFEEGEVTSTMLGAHPAKIRELLASRCVA